MSALRIGNAPCSWGSLEFEGFQAKPIGYSRMLDELVETGYTGTELGDWGFMPTDPAALHRELRARQVTLLGAFVPVALKFPEARSPGEVRVLQVARLLTEVHQRDGGGAEDSPFLVLADDNGSDATRTAHAGRVPASMGLGDAAWDAFAQGANRIADAVRRETGLRTVFHHHCAGYVETPDEIATLLRKTDPALLGLVFDTGHLAFGSGDYDAGAVCAALDRFSDRIWYMHFKDCDPDIARKSRSESWDYFTSVRQGVFCELGKGCVDFAGVMAWLRQRAYRGWIVVEQDVLPGMGSPRESALRNREFLRTLGL